MQSLNVALGARAYDIHIGGGLLARAAELIGPHLARPRTAIVTDQNVARHHLESLSAALAAGGIDAPALVLPAGEKTKSWTRLEETCDWLLAQQIERNDRIIAFGGGVIGDLAGFAGAVLRRGIGVIQLPTSLLAQVDSSVGGKTGINASHGKNLIGAFHQPDLVLADIDVLSTLPARDFRAGYGEVVKYGALGDANFFAWLEENGPAMAEGDGAARAHAVAHCCKMKAEIVGRDEREAGERALLNLGHTFGHALEAATGYSARLLHGEAVAVGMGLAFDLSAALGLCDAQSGPRLRAHLHCMGMMANLKDIEGDLPDSDGLIALMAQDKKVEAGQLVFILARSIGEAFIARDVPLEKVRDVLNAARG